MSNPSNRASLLRPLCRALGSALSVTRTHAVHLRAALRSGLGDATKGTRQFGSSARKRVRTFTGTLFADLKKLAQADRSLQRQLALLLVCMSLAFVGVSCLLQSQLIMPAFASLERQAALRDVDRCLAGIQRDLDLLSDVTNDWGAWDDTYQFAADRNGKFQQANLTPEAFSSARVGLIAVLNASRELVWGECRDPESVEVIEAPGIWPMLTDPASPLTQHAGLDDVKSGLVLTSAGPLLISSSPIITSKRQGPIRGSIMMGRFLNQEEIGELADRAEVDLTARVLGKEPLAEAEAAVLEELRHTGSPVLHVHNAESLLAYAKVDDVFGKPGLLLRLTLPREVSAQGNIAGLTATWGGILGSLAIMTAAALLVRRRVVKPLEEIVIHARQIGEKSDFKARLNSGRDDEIGQLSNAFDEMVECLAISRKRVMEAAHRAGMADVASEVLHNVGNVINSAKTSLEQLEGRTQSINLDSLKKAVALLQEHSGGLPEFFSQDPRGPKLVSFLGKVAAAMEEESASNQENLARIGKAIRHIQEIVAGQERRAHTTADCVSDTDVAELFREAVAMNLDRIESAGIEAQVLVDPPLELSLNRSKMSQVLINLVRNGVQAMEGCPEPRTLILSARDTGDQHMEIEIRDTGCGLSPELKGNLFRHGFTTKPGGQGIGLHYCANAVQSMGGSIRASSEGPGRGTSFLIRIPRDSPADAEPRAKAA